MSKREKLYIHEVEIWDNLYYKGKETNYWISTTGKIMNKYSKNLIKTFISNSGYERASLFVDGKRVKMSIHRAVAITFIPIPNEYIKLGLDYDDLVPNHKDGNKLHNDRYNLEWMTNRENTIDAINTGLISYIGENSHLATIDRKTAIKCCKMLSEGIGLKEVSEKLGISRKIVAHIKYGECWKEVSQHFTFPINDKPKPNSVPIETIHEICKLLELKKYTDKEIANKFGLAREYIRDIRNHKRQKVISDKYNF